MNDLELIPAFEIGLWNAWIFVLLSFLTVPVAGFLINKEAMEKFGESENIECSERERISGKIISFLSPIFIIYSIFLPMKLGTTWFYMGFSIIFLAYIIGFISVVSFVTTSIGRLVTKGTYRISRNPICLAGVLLDLGVGIACTSWIYLLYAIFSLILMDNMVKAEERFLLKKYGKTYYDYKEKTPKWI